MQTIYTFKVLSGNYTENGKKHKLGSQFKTTKKLHESFPGSFQLIATEEPKEQTEEEIVSEICDYMTKVNTAFKAPLLPTPMELSNEGKSLPKIEITAVVDKAKTKDLFKLVQIGRWWNIINESTGKPVSEKNLSKDKAEELLAQYNG